LASELGVAWGTGGDVMLATIAGDRVPAVPVTQVDAYEHPRVARASRYRRDVQVYVTDDEAGVLTIGRGIADRYEIAFEVERRARESGLGRALVSTAIALVPTGEAVWAQVHPANAASLRTVLAAGFLPIGYEQLIDGGR
jgi:hypothetical protein